MTSKQELLSLVAELQAAEQRVAQKKQELAVAEMEVVEWKEQLYKAAKNAKATKGQ